MAERPVDKDRGSCIWRRMVRFMHFLPRRLCGLDSSIRTERSVMKRSVSRRQESQRVERFWAIVSTTPAAADFGVDRKSTRLNSSHVAISYAVFCLKEKRDR